MTALVYGAFILLLAITIAWHVRGVRRREASVVAAGRSGGSASGPPTAQHPHIDVDHCIGCGGCVTACPEGDVLAVIGGKAALVNGAKCIGHGLCADACPVGAIEIVMASPSMTADLPARSAELETNVPNLFIAGELGGLALIKNAIREGRASVDAIAARLPELRRRLAGEGGLVDIVVIGAGPAGLSASLRAAELGIGCITLEAESVGGTVAKYPRQKLVLTSPMELPVIGKFAKLEIGKEELLALWERAAAKTGLTIRSAERVLQVEAAPDGPFSVATTAGAYRARAVVIAIGRRGTPTKLGIPGEELAHVMYSLLDAEAYTGKQILVVGGGDSAVEAAMGLALQPGNRVVLSYRRAAFSRLKDRNERRIEEAMRKGTVTVLFNSEPREVTPKAVTLDVAGTRREIPADFVWILAGTAPPKAFLDRIGIASGHHDLSGQVRTELAGDPR